MRHTIRLLGALLVFVYLCGAGNPEAYASSTKAYHYWFHAKIDGKVALFRQFSLANHSVLAFRLKKPWDQWKIQFKADIQRDKVVSMNFQISMVTGKKEKIISRPRITTRMHGKIGIDISTGEVSISRLALKVYPQRKSSSKAPEELLQPWPAPGKSVPCRKRKPTTFPRNRCSPSARTEESQ